jgi:hypothetical protein
MSGLTALNPSFLSLLPLAALPLIFHLFFRLKKHPRAFPTLMLFHRIDPRLNARRRLREWLTLLVRALLIVFVVLCLAHPVWFGVGKEGSVAIVLLLDNSGSMSGTGENGRVKLKEAVGGARTLVSQLRAGDSAGIVLLVPDPAVPLPAGLTADKAALKDALEHLAETEAGGSVATAVQRALAMLEGGGAAHSEIHVFSDLQEEKWNQAPLGSRVPPRGSTVVVHRVPSTPARANIVLAGTQLGPRSILPGRRIPVEARLVNASPVEGRPRLNWLDDAGNRGSREFILPPQAEKTASFDLEPQNPGIRWVNVWVEGDDFSADNHAPLSFSCSERRPVLFAGTASEYGQLPLAISPSGEGRLSGLVPLFVDNADVVARLRGQHSGLVVLTWESFGIAGADSAARWSALKDFLTAGGTALLVPSTAVGSFGTPPGWLGVTPGPLERVQAGLALSALAKSHTMFNDLRDEKGEVALHNVKAFRFHPLRATATNNPVLGLEDGRVVVAEQNVGRGRLLASGLAFDSAWSTLPLKPGFVALAQNLALTQAAPATNILSLVAGEPLRLSLSQDAAIRVQSLAGSPLDWKGSAARLPTLPRSGIYTVRSGAETVYCAVRSSEKEGRQRFLAGDALPALGKLSYAVRQLAGGQGLVSEFRKLEKSLDLSWLLLLLAFAAFVAEGRFANPLPIKAKPRETKPIPALEPVE